MIGVIIILFLIGFLLRKFVNYEGMTGGESSIIKSLLKQAIRWSIASEQDSHPFIANLHANYGAGYIYALRSIASDEEIKAETGVDAFELEKIIVGIQDNAYRRLGKTCPNIVKDIRPEFRRILS